MYDGHKIYFDLYLIDTIRKFIRNTNYIINAKHACHQHLIKIQSANVHYIHRGNVSFAVNINERGYLRCHVVDIAGVQIAMEGVAMSAIIYNTLLSDIGKL